MAAQKAPSENGRAVILLTPSMVKGDGCHTGQLPAGTSVTWGLSLIVPLPVLTFASCREGTQQLIRLAPAIDAQLQAEPTELCWLTLAQDPAEIPGDLQTSGTEDVKASLDFLASSHTMNLFK